MKVILAKQVPNLGNPGDVVDVAPGYARNFLIAGSLAREATVPALRELEAGRVRKARQRERQAHEREKLAKHIARQRILVRATANEAGHLFGGVGRQEIADAILKRKKISVDPKRIILPHHLKTLGEHEVVLELGGGETAPFIVDIQRIEE